MARPTVKTTELVKKLLACFENDFTTEEACWVVWISKQTFYTWIKEDQELSDDIETAKRFCAIKAKKTIKENLDKPEMAKRYAERKLKNQWYANRTELTDWNGNPLSLKSILSDIQGNGSNQPWDTTTQSNAVEQTTKDHVGEDLQD